MKRRPLKRKDRKERKVMKNKYPGDCVICGKRVEAGEGFPEKHNGVWKVRCLQCVIKNQERKAQRDPERYGKFQKKESCEAASLGKDGE